MSAALATSLLIKLVVNEYLDSTENKSAGPIQHVLDAVIKLSNGTAAGKADKGWSDRRSVGATTIDPLDLAGSLTDSSGAALTFAKVKIIILVNRGSADLEVGPHATNGFGIGTVFKDVSDRGIVPAASGGVYGYWVWFAPAGVAVTAATADIFDVHNPSGGSVDYDVFVVGTSA